MISDLTFVIHDVACFSVIGFLNSYFDYLLIDMYRLGKLRLS